MNTIYVFFEIPSGRKIMYVNCDVKTIGPKLFEATTAEQLRDLADTHQPYAVDFADSRFPRKATPIEKVIQTKMFEKYVRFNVHH